MWKKRILSFLLCLCMVIPSELATLSAEGTVESEVIEDNTMMEIPECVCNTADTTIYNHADDCVLKTYCKNLVDTSESVDALYLEYQKLPENGQQCVLDYLNAVNYYGHAKEGWYTQLQALVQGGAEEDVCDICNNKGCTIKHIFCDVCQDYDCGKTHVWCENCVGYDCGIVHDAEYPTIYDTIVDSEGNVQTVTVSAEEFPIGAKLSVESADVTEQLASYGIDSSKQVFGLDISVLNADSSEYQPGGALVKIPVNADAGLYIGIIHNHNGDISFLGVTEVLSDGTVEFYTDNFSEFAGFTVDFHYNGVDFSIEGLSSILLSELFEKMGINEDAYAAETVVFSNDKLVTTERRDDGDWLLTSLEAFLTEETLVITFTGGRTIVIDVTDATGVTKPLWDGAGSILYNTPFLGGNGHTVSFVLTGDDVNGSLTTKVTNFATAAGNRYFTLYFPENASYWYNVSVSDSGFNPSLDSSKKQVNLEKVKNETVTVTRYDRVIKVIGNTIEVDQQRYATLGATENRTVKVIVNNNESNPLINEPVVFPNVGSDIAPRQLDVFHIWTSKYYYYKLNNQGQKVEHTRTELREGVIKYIDDNGTTYTYDAETKTYTIRLLTRYNVEFNANGGSGTMDNQPFIWGIGQNLNANAFVAPTYTVSYVSNGGTACSDASVNTKFAGWATSASGSKTFDNAANIPADKPLSAEPGGTVPLYALWNTTSTVTLPTLTKTGHTFKGWYADPGFSEESKVGDAGASYTPTANTTLYAKWTVNDYTIDYTLNGGTVNPANPTSYNVETETFTLNNPTRANYTFAGWTGTGLSAATKTVTIEKGSAGNRAYIATWELNAYTVTGEIASGQGTISLPTQTVNYGGNGQAITFTTENGYVISAITVDGQSIPVEDSSKYTHTPTNVQKSYSVIVTMLPVEYTITYKDGSNVISTVKYTIEDNIALAAAPTKAGYTFNGWKPESNVGSWTASSYIAGVNIGTGQYGNVILVAHWQINSYTVTGIIDRGTVNNVAATDTNPYKQVVNYGYSGEKMTFTPATGYEISSITINDADQTVSNKEIFEYTPTNVVENIEVVVSTIPKKYKITWNLKYPDDAVKTYFTQVDVPFGSDISSPEVSVENYVFSDDWQVTSPKVGEVPDTMPNNDLVIQGSLVFNGGSLTITKSGMEAGKSTVFNISGDGLSKPISVTIEGSGSVTINYLPVGTYIVKEEIWSWEHICVGETPSDSKVDGIATVEISKGSTANVTFNNQKKTSLGRWLSGEFRKNNKFGAVSNN